MADIQVKKNGPETTKAITPARDPFRMLRELMQWDPFKEMMPLTTEIGAFSPSFEIKETKDGYVFKADVPGLKESDLDVSVTGNRLTIAGKREEEKEEKGDRYYTCERTYGSFSRMFTLPDDADGTKTQADLKDGVLTLTVSKKHEAQAKQIAINATKKS